MDGQNERWLNSTNWKPFFCRSKFQVIAYVQNIKQSIIQTLINLNYKLNSTYKKVRKNNNKKNLEITFQIWIKRVGLGIRWWIKKNTRLVATMENDKLKGKNNLI
jgi:hypothetical protein